MKAVVLTFDRLPAHLLGCYGNEWIETPGFDRLAAASRVFDQHFAELPGQVGPNHSWWTGQFEFFAYPSADRSVSDGSTVSWFRSLSESGVQCRLLAENLEGLPTELFDASESCGGSDGLNVEHEEVPIARLVQRAITLLDEGTTQNSSTQDARSANDDGGPDLLWLHSRGVPSPWLPPRLFAELYLDELEELLDGESGSEIASSLVSQFETDPELVRLLLSDWQRDAEVEEASETSAVPTDSGSEPAPESGSGEVESRELERQISRLVFAGYVSMIDRWLLTLLSAIENCDERVLLIVSANQGRSFGEAADLLIDPVSRSSSDSTKTPEHSHVQGEYQQASPLCDSELRTPLMIAEFKADSNDPSFGSRHSALVQPVDVATTLHAWFCREHRESPDQSMVNRPLLAGNDLLEAQSGGTPAGHDMTFHLSVDGQMAVRNRHWLLVTDGGDAPDGESVRLFAKPDDQWDVHDVASQYPHEVETLLGALRDSVPTSSVLNKR